MRRALPNHAFGYLVEEVQLVEVDRQRGSVAYTRSAARIDTGDEGLRAAEQIQEDFVAHQFSHVHLRFDGCGLDAGRREVGVVDILRADAHHDRLAEVIFECRVPIERDAQPQGFTLRDQLLIRSDQLHLEEVHAGTADEARHELIAGPIVQSLRRIDLLQDAFLHHGDA